MRVLRTPASPTSARRRSRVVSRRSISQYPTAWKIRDGGIGLCGHPIGRTPGDPGIGRGLCRRPVAVRAGRMAVRPGPASRRWRRLRRPRGARQGVAWSVSWRGPFICAGAGICAELVVDVLDEPVDGRQVRRRDRRRGRRGCRRRMPASRPGFDVVGPGDGAGIPASAACEATGDVAVAPSGVERRAHPAVMTASSRTAPTMARILRRLRCSHQLAFSCCATLTASASLAASGNRARSDHRAVAGFCQRRVRRHGRATHGVRFGARTDAGSVAFRMEHIWGRIGAHAPDHPTRSIRALERLAVGSVAITERAIASAGTDLTFVQWRVLLIVGEQDGGVRVGEIAERIGAHASPTSRLISRLKSRGVVMTEKDELDGRATRVRLTTVGRALRGRVLEHRRQDLATLAPKLELTPRRGRGDRRGCPGARMVRLNAQELLRTLRKRVRAAAYLRKWVILGALIGVISGLGAALFFVSLELGTKFFLGTLAGFVPASPLGEGAHPDHGCGPAVGHPARRGARRAHLRDHRLPMGARGRGPRNRCGDRRVPSRRPADPGQDSARQARCLRDHDRVGWLGWPRRARRRRSGPGSARSSPASSTSTRATRGSPSAPAWAPASAPSSGRPLGGAVLAVEVPYREDVEADALVPAFVGSIVAFSIFGTIVGFDPDLRARSRVPASPTRDSSSTTR